MSLIRSLIGRVLPEGEIKNTATKLHYERLLMKYNIKIICKVGERIYEFGNGSIILYIDDKWAVGFRKPNARDLFREYLRQIREIVIDEKYEKLCKPKIDDIVIDAGASMGVFTVKTARTVGERGSVIAVEPDSQSLGYLRKNLYLNRLHNVITINKALWSSCGELVFKRFVDWAGSASSIASLRPDDKGDFGERLTAAETVKVPATTIDEIVSDLSLERVDMIKMDIERSEVEAVKGARNTLTKFTPKLAIAAYHRIPPKYQRSYEILASMLRDIGYSTRIAKIGEEFYLYADSA